MSNRLSLGLLALSALVGLHAATAQRGLPPIKPVPSDLPDPQLTACSDDSCCRTDHICYCGGCFPEGDPIQDCAGPGPGIVYSCCDDEGAKCNRCNGECCLGDDVCSCKGFCISKFARGPACGPDDYDELGFPKQTCCQEEGVGKRCSGSPE